MSAKKASVLLKLVVVLVVLGAAGAAVAYYLRPVAKVAVVKRGLAQDIVPGSVVVEAEHVSPVTNEIDGKVKLSSLRVGQVVKEGEVLVELDSSDLDADIKHAEAELTSAKANIKIAKVVSDLRWTATEEALANTKRNFEEQKNVAKAAMDQAERDHGVAEQLRLQEDVNNARTLENLQNTLATLQLKKKKMTILAPVDGTIRDVFAYRNHYLSGRQVLANVSAQNRLVKAKIGEERFAAIRVGDKATVSFLGYPGEKFTAVVTEKLPIAEPETQRYIAYLKVEIPSEKLLPGLTGEVGVIVGEHSDVVVVERRAMWDGRFVYVIDGGRVRERGIFPGFLDYNFVEVKSGLEPGDRVIVEEKDQFHDGQRIRVAPATP